MRQRRYFCLHVSFRMDGNAETKIRDESSPHTASPFIDKQTMLLLVFASHVSCDPFNLTSFASISDPSGFETIEWNDEGEYAGGGGPMFDRVVANEPPSTWVRMYMYSGFAMSIVIMTNNDILQTKYMAGIWRGLRLSSSSIGDSLHIIIENVTNHMGISYDDAKMMTEYATIIIGSKSDSQSRGTWTSTIVPENVTVELDCVVVDNSNSIVTAKCGSDQWSESVFNRIPIRIDNGAQFGYDDTTNHAMFGKTDFSIDGSVPSGWKQYGVTGSGSNFTIGNQFTIMSLPESFVSHWANMGAQALMGDDRIMLVPPDGS